MFYSLIVVVAVAEDKECAFLRGEGRRVFFNHREKEKAVPIQGLKSRLYQLPDFLNYLPVFYEIDGRDFTQDKIFISCK